MRTLCSATRNALLRVSIILPAIALCLAWRSQSPRAAQAPQLQGSIEVDSGEVTGQVPHYLFGQFIEHEHNTIDDGLLAQLLHDRKFEEGSPKNVNVSHRTAKVAQTPFSYLFPAHTVTVLELSGR